ncbi:O-antigen ligase family protein [Weizmannia ginsengihumi]|nr:O-antigen ligase family protein [Heyndrickxia ginsengihumi]
MIQIVLSAVVITFIVNRYSLISTLKATFFAGAIMTICSYITVYVYPSWGLMTESFVGLWRGIFTHKNLLSVFSCFHIMISIFLLLNEKKFANRFIYFFVAILQLLLIFFSGSSTGIVTLVIATIFSLSLVFIIKIKNKYLLAAFSTFYLFLISLSIYITIDLIGKIVSAFGKDLTFSGRTIIWQAVIQMIKEKPLFGYGYGTFWQVGSLTYNYVNEYVPDTDFHLQSHNGFLDIFTSIGLVGFILIMITIFIYLKRNLILILRTKNNIFLFPLIYLIFFIIYNLQESFFIEQNFVMWTFYVYFYTLLSLKTKEKDNNLKISMKDQ